MVTRMKAAASPPSYVIDFSMNKSLMAEATKQEWFPEWFFTGAIYGDIGILSRPYPADQSAHASRAVVPQPVHGAPIRHRRLPTCLSTKTNPLNWYWGGTRPHKPARSAPTSCGPQRDPGRGSEAHAEDVAPRLFAIPPRLGAAQGRVDSFMTATGKDRGSPTTSTRRMGRLRAVLWDRPPPARRTVRRSRKGVGWDATPPSATKAGTWPKKQFKCSQVHVRCTTFATLAGDGAPTYAGSLDSGRTHGPASTAESIAKWYTDVDLSNHLNCFFGHVPACSALAGWRPAQPLPTSPCRSRGRGVVGPTSTARSRAHSARTRRRGARPFP